MRIGVSGQEPSRTQQCIAQWILLDRLWTLTSYSIDVALRRPEAPPTGDSSHPTRIMTRASRQSTAFDETDMSLEFRKEVNVAVPKPYRRRR
jgi:hypothetical protein